MNIEQLAKEMNVTTNDIMNLAQSVMNHLTQYGISETFLTMSQDQQVETIQAYVSHAVKKMKEFQISYMTNTNVNSLFNDMVYGVLKNE